MLKKFASYGSVAFGVMLFSGILTKFAEAKVGDRLTREEFGAYWHFILVLELLSGFFIVGIDHALVTFINREEGNHPRFVRLLLSYGVALTAVMLAAGFLLRSAGLVGPMTALGIMSVGPFVLAELGKITFRAKLDKRREFGFLLVQSLMWSLGCLALIDVFPVDVTPVLLHFLAILLISTGIALVLAPTARADGSGTFCLRPFGAEYGSLWQQYRPLWIAGAAFLANTHVQTLMVDRMQARDGLAEWRFISIMLMFLHRPIMLIQRAALPIFTQDKEDVYDGFRKLVRLNLLFFPLLAIFVLGAYPFVLSYGTLSKYDGTWVYLAIVVSATPFMSTEFLVGTLSMALDKPRNVRNAHCLTAAINVPVAFVLIRQLEILGAALSTAFYVMLFCATMFWFSRKDLGEYVVFATRKLLVAGPALWGASALIALADDLYETFFMTCIAGIAYLAAAWMVGVWNVENVRWIVSRFRR